MSIANNDIKKYKYWYKEWQITITIISPCKINTQELVEIFVKIAHFCK